MIVLLYLVARRRTWWTIAAAAVAYAGLLWTHTRAAYLALALGLVVLAARAAAPAPRRRLRRPRSSSASAFVKAFPAHRAVDELHAGRARVPPGAGTAAPRVSATTRSARATPRRRATCATCATGSASSCTTRRDSASGTPGVNASRTGVEIKAGESTYTELGVDTGLVGLARLLAWMVAVLVGAVAALGVAQRRVGRDARDRAPDRRDRGALDRVRPLCARRLRRSAAACR